MRVVLLNQYYAPDHAATAQLAADLGAELAHRGHEVTAIASDRAYAADDDGARLPARERISGVEVRRVRATALGRSHRLARATDYASFYAGAAAELLRLPRADVIVALTTPPFLGTLAALEAARRGSRFVLWVMDVYPEIAIALGAVAAGGLLGRGLTALSAGLLRRADAVVALDDAMRARLIAAGAAAERTVVIDNWWEAGPEPPRAVEESAFRRSLGCGDRFVVAYFGNLGLGHDFDTLLEAISRLGPRDDYGWLFVGHGPQEARVARALAERGVWHRFQAPVPREALADALAAADALYVSLDARLAGLVAPSKLYCALSAARPVVYVGPAEGRSAELVEDEQCGIGVRNGDVASLCAGLERLRLDPRLRGAMGARARALHQARYDRGHGVAAHHALLERVVGRC